MKYLRLQNASVHIFSLTNCLYLVYEGKKRKKKKLRLLFDYLEREKEGKGKRIRKINKQMY